MPTFKNNFTKSLDIFNTVLIYFCVIVVPGILFYFGLELSKGKNISYIQEEWWRKSIIFLGIIVISLRILNVLVSDIEELTDIKAELRFIFAHAKTAWSIGAGLACVLTGAYFLIPAKDALHDRFEAVFSIFFSVIGITLAVHVLYRNMAPIIGTNKLLDAIIDDLEKCSDQSSIWIVYPALNIGFYRALRNGEFVWNHRNNTFNFKHRCGRFYKVLREAIESKHLQAIALTYSKDKYRKLYEIYHNMISEDEKNGKHGAFQPEGNPNIDYVDLSVRSAEILINLFELSTTSHVKFECLDAEQFPQHVIIIGDVVYLIVSYGIPIYDKVSNEFRPIEGESEPADLLTWRRKDAVLAKMISAHLRKLIETKRPGG